ncbi:MAG: helix-turn-helix transcriptional regulator [Actinobacteria bacterium]|nr:helix-turn-helix transcriptional regulator [Actinomycetota bacterium]
MENPAHDPTRFLPLPQAQYHVLVALTAGEMHGYAVMQQVEALSDGVVRMGPGTLYGTLKRLVDTGLAEETEERPAEGDDARRRYYRLTGLGRAVCIAESDRLADLATRSRANLRIGTA